MEGCNYLLLFYSQFHIAIKIVLKSVFFVQNIEAGRFTHKCYNKTSNFSHVIVLIFVMCSCIPRLENKLCR